MNFLEENLNSIVLGNSYNLIKQIPDKTIDCIYTDIPYLYSNGFVKPNKKYIGTTQKLIDELKPMINGIDYSIYDEFIRVSKIGNIFIWLSKEQLLYTLNYFTKQGFNFNLLFWCKNNPAPLGHNTYLPDTEYCIHFTKKGVILNNGYDLKFKLYFSPLNQYDRKLYKHPTIKPIKLVERHLLHATKKDDLVFDPFSGSGTTCLAAKETNRNYLGIEIDEKWHKISVDRLNGINANGQTSIFTNFDKLGDDENRRKI